MKLLDITGQRFGTYLVIKRMGSIRGNAAWLCKCDCGKEKVIAQRVLKSRAKNGKGCFCGHYGHKHGESQTRLYKIYIGIKSRCYRKNSAEYHCYGGRGITICDEWLGEYGFLNFRDWAYKNGYQDNLTIDRIDNDGNYEPSNCRWATRNEQDYNKSNTVYITYDGETRTIHEWSEIVNIPAHILGQRNRSGWSVKDVLFTPYKNLKRKPLEYRNIKPEKYKGKIYGYSIRVGKKHMGFCKTIEEAQRIRNGILSREANG